MFDVAEYSGYADRNLIEDLHKGDAIRVLGKVSIGDEYRIIANDGRSGYVSDWCVSENAD